MFLLPIIAVSQTPITWKTLSQLELVPKRGGQYEKPRFSDALKALDGQQVTITGYMLPLTVDRDEYILSMRPYTDCYFCGGGGIETVMELKLQEKGQKFKLDDQLTFTGILRLNSKPYELIFFLENAVVVD